MDILCLDLEGVLVPEIWQGVAERTRIKALEQTTRDIPVYDDLMQMRLEVMREHDLRLDVVHEVVAELEPLEGAQEFLQWARTHFQIAVVSDTFYELALPLVEKLGAPMLLCHSMQSSRGRVTGYQLRQDDPKRHAVKGFQQMNYRVHAAGDSFNDLSMLEQADCGYFYSAPPRVTARIPGLPCAANHTELRELLTAAYAAPAADRCTAEHDRISSRAASDASTQSPSPTAQVA